MWPQPVIGWRSQRCFWRPERILLGKEPSLQSAAALRRDGYLENPLWDPKSQVAMIRPLLKAGANIHAQDKNGATPLHRAVRTRCAAAVKCLLEAVPIRRSRNKPGSTPFHLAVQNTGRGGSGSEKACIAQREILQAFLERGVSPTLKDAKGKSVLEWARSEWIRELLARPIKCSDLRMGNMKEDRQRSSSSIICLDLTIHAMGTYITLHIMVECPHVVEGR